MKVLKSKNTEVQSLLFPKAIWPKKDAEKWIAKHKYSKSKPEHTAEYFRYRQESPDMFQAKSFRTITLTKAKPVKAIIARPWVPMGNPKCVLMETIHIDWGLHRRKHEIYGQLARLKGTGKYNQETAKRRFKPLVVKAATLYRREHKIKPAVSKVFPTEKINFAIGKLINEFGQYWKKGQLDQYLPRSAWKKRQEK